MIGVAAHLLGAGSSEYMNGLVVIQVTQGAATKLLVSSNSTSWTSYTAPAPIASNPNGIMMSDGEYFYYFLNNGFYTYYISSDGHSWATQTAPFSTVYAAMSGRVVAYDPGTGTIRKYTSPDAINWTMGSTVIPFGTNAELRLGIFPSGPYRWLIVNPSGTSVFSADDGVNWFSTMSNLSPGPTALNYAGSTYPDGIAAFSMCGTSGGTDFVNMTSGGGSWAKTTLGPALGDAPLNISSPAKLLALSGRYYSENGILWNKNTGTVISGQGGVYANGYFIKVTITTGSSVLIQISKNGITWSTAATLSSSTAVLNICRQHI